MKPIVLPPPTKRSAKDFLLFLVPEVMRLFNFPEKILIFDTLAEARKQIYSYSEETAEKKLNKLKELINQYG